MPDVWINLAHVYFAQGNFSLAVKMVRVLHFIMLSLFFFSPLNYLHVTIHGACYLAVSELLKEILL